jgi:Zn-dependent protease
MFIDISGAGIVVALVSLILSVSAHEAMHGYMAHWLGDSTAQDAGRLTMNPLKHIDLYTSVLLPMATLLLFHSPFMVAKPVPFNPARLKFDEFGAALVGFAGPLTNIVLATVASIYLRLAVNSLTQTSADYIGIFIGINIAIFVINMIPIPPLDGSRVLYAFAPSPVRKIMEQIESFGFASIMVIFLLILYLFSSKLLLVETNIGHLLLGYLYPYVL